MAFAFDLKRQAILLIAGDKGGIAQKLFYKGLIARSVRPAPGRFGETMMGRTHDEVMAAMPADRRARIEEKAAGMMAEIEGLKALRLLADRSQEQIAQALSIKQPAVLKIERQTDLYLSTLRRFVEAAGGTLELRIELPGKGVMHLTGMGELAP